MTDDHELLAQYARTGSEAAFATLVMRYVNLVHSAAMRFTGNPHHAEEITQAVFIILARKAGSLRRDAVLSGWLYQTARLTAANFVKGEIRRHHREQEAYMQSTLNEPAAAAWGQIAPMLDEAMGRLGETDRNAVVLRFFENKTAQEVATTLKMNEAAAHKRVNRAVDKLRKFFTKRGVTLSAAALGGTMAANSVQAAPVGLAVTISATTLKGAAVAASVTALVNGTIKTIIMTTIQKTLIAATLVAAVGAGIYEARQASTLQTQVQALRQQQAPLTDQNQQLTSKLDDATRQLAALRDDNERLKRNTTEIPKLRGDAARLRQSQQELAQLKAKGNTNNGWGDALAKALDNPEYKNEMRDRAAKAAKQRYAPVFQELKLTPEEQEKMIGIMVETQMSMMEKDMAILKGGDKTEIAKAIADALARGEEAKKTLLGDDRFTQFAGFDNTVAARSTMDGFRIQLAENNLLNDGQTKQLLDAITQERAHLGISSAANQAALIAGGDGQNMLNAEEQLNQRVLTRAAAILNAEQLAALKLYQEEKIGMMKLNIKARSDLLGEKKN